MKVTANAVTVTRIVLLPIPCALLLFEETWAYALAVVTGAILGATDFVDGWLARRDGPTRLGALLDPAADKLFFVALVLPLVVTGHCPAWAAAGIITRELLITALRSSISERGADLATSRLGKMKTVAQMGGLAVFYFVALLPADYGFIAHASGLALLAIVVVWSAVKGKLPPYWALGGGGLWAAVVVVQQLFGVRPAVITIFSLMLALAVLSGMDYVVSAARVLMRAGVSRTDIGRVFVALSQGGAGVMALHFAPHLVVPIVVSLAAELFTSGLDNLATASQGRAVRVPFGWSGVPPVATLLLAVVGLGAPWTLGAAVVQATVSIAIAVRAYFRDRELLA